MPPTSRLAIQREGRSYRIFLIALAFLLMGAASWPSGCNGSDSSSGSSPGEVLIAGGEDSSGSILRSAELFDPSKGTFSYVSNDMSDGRASETATLLENGRVLLAGGVNGGGAMIDSADLYAPSAQKFSATGAMNDPREECAATLLDSGKVLITGGLEIANSASGLYTAEVYDPSTGNFTATGDMNDARWAHRSTLLQVLITGGVSGAGASFSGAELYNPSTNSFSATGSLIDARAFHSATLLSDGRVLITGGQDASGNSLDSAELYDPSTATFSATGSMMVARQSHRATLLDNGEVLITGGETLENNTATVLDAAELYDPSTGKFSAVGAMTDSRVFHTATLLKNGKVLIAGGEDQTGVPVDSAELYDPSTGDFTATTGTMKQSRAFQTATLVN